MLDPAEPVSIGAMVGPEAFMEVRYLAHAKQLMALERIPQIAAEFEQQLRPQHRRAGARLPPRGRRDHRRRARLGAGHAARRRSTSCAREGQSIGVLGISSFRPFPLAAVRAALQGAKRVVVLEKSFSVGLGGVVSTDVRLALSGLQLHGYTVVAGLGGRAITQASLRRMLLEAVAGKLPPLSFLDLDWRIVNRQLEREAQIRRSGPIAENLLRDVGPCASKVRLTHERTQVKFYQTGTFTVGNRLLEPEQRSVQASTERSNSLNSGHRACQGCGEALGARYAVDAAMRATGNRLIAANATGCLEVFSTPYPETRWQLPWIH